MTNTPIDPARTAVLAMDFEGATLGFRPDPTPLVDAANKVIAAVRSGGGTVGFVRVAFKDDEYALFPSDSMMGQRVTAGRPNLDDGAPTSALHSGLDYRADDVNVRKIRVGAFSTTDLHDQLQRAGVRTLVLTGVHTSGVILSTVREAHDLDYRVIVVADACDDPESDVHEFLVTRIFPKQATVLDSDDVVSLVAS